MLICACGAAIPRAASFCPGCGKGVNGRRCADCKAVSPLAASHCVSCGGTRLSGGANAFRIGCVPRFIAWGLALVTLRLALGEGWLLRALNAAFAFVFERPFGSVVESAVAVTVSLGTFALLLEGMLGDRIPVFKPYVRTVGKALGFLPKAAVWSFRALLYAVEGVEPPKERKSVKRKEGKEAPP